MYRHAGISAESALASAIYLAGSLSFSALAQGAPPEFAPNASIGWYAYSRQFIPPASGPGPVQQDPARPFVSNDEFRVTGRQPTQESRPTPRTPVAGPLAFPASCSDP
jgi:hypothetical protein